MSGLEQGGGLEKEDLTGNVSYDSINHEFMVKTRVWWIVADFIPNQQLDAGSS